MQYIQKHGHLKQGIAIHTVTHNLCVNWTERPTAKTVQIWTVPQVTTTDVDCIYVTLLQKSTEGSPNLEVM